MAKPISSSPNNGRAVISSSDIASEIAIADALFLSIGEGAIVIDPEGKVSRINQAALDILGFTRKELMGKWYPEAVIAEDESGQRIPNIERPIAEVFLSGKTIFRKVYYIRKDGSKVAVALTISPVFLKSKPIGAIEVFRDITEEVKLDKAKDEFISLASHQLRTPATGVKQYLTMMLDGYTGELTKDQREYIKTANQSNDRQLVIIDDILRVATADSGTLDLSKESADLVPLIKEVIDEQKSKFESRNQKVTFIHGDSVVHAYIDKDLFRMVLENIIDNAYKYTFPGKCIEIGVSLKDKVASVYVKDEGTGIDKKDFDKLFQKFSRLHNALSVSSGGTGLGLYWAKQIIKLHGGTIEVSSKPGKGTTFTINIQAEQGEDYNN